MEELKPGDLVIVNDDTWLYGGEKFMEFHIVTTIKKGTLGVVVGMQSSEHIKDDHDTIPVRSGILPRLDRLGTRGIPNEG